MQRTLLAPNRLQLLVWGGAVLAYLAAFGELPPTSVLVWVAALGVTFSLGATLAAGRRQVATCRPSRSQDALGRAVRGAAFGLVPIQMLYAYQTAIAAQEHGGLVRYLAAVRVAALAGEPLIEHYNVYLQVNTIQLVLLQYAIAGILLGGGGSLRSTYTIYGFTLLATMADGSRAVFVTGLLSLLALHLAVGRLKATTLGWIVAALVAIFALTFTAFRADTSDSDVGDITRMPFVYYSGSLGSMRPILDDNLHVYWFDLEAISNKLSTIGLPFPTFELADLKSDYIDLPRGHFTNVFSAFGLYYDYMGTTGAIAFVLLLGASCGIAYRMLLSSPLGLTIYGLTWSAIVLLPFHDYFVGQAYTVAKLLFCLAVLRVPARVLSSVGQAPSGHCRRPGVFQQVAPG